MNQQTISCDLHDYFEIACLYGYRVRLILKDGEIVEGKACDLISVEKREYLVLDNEQAQQVDLTRIAKMQVLTIPAQFDEVSLK